MAAVSMSPADLEPFASIDEAKALVMIDDAIALAARVAPCIITEDFEYPAAARAILRAAVLRWHDAGSGALASHQVGQVSESYDNRQPRRGMFWPSEIEALQSLCQGDETPAGAFAIDTAPYAGNVGHADICALNFGAVYCSCGAVLTNNLYPLYEYDSLPGAW